MDRRLGGFVMVLATLGCTPTDATEGARAVNRRAPPMPSQGPSPAPEQGPGHEPAFVGSEGTHPDGDPRRRPDQVAIRTLLRLGRLADLDRWMVHFQQEFEKDPNKETWALDAFEAFATADPSLGPLLDAWVTATPESFAPLAARGIWREACGSEARGGDVASKTSAAQFDAMRGHFEAARSDLERAIALRPTTIAAHLGLMAIAKVAGDDTEVRARFEAAVAHCPACYEPRAMRLTALEPRWGGSYPAMAAFVAESRSLMEAHPKLRRLRGFAAWDRCRIAAGDHPAQALAACDEAIGFGEDPRFLVTRSRLLGDTGRVAEARTDLDRALELSPHNVDARQARYYLRRDRADDLLGAAEDLAVAFALDPGDAALAKSRAWMLDKLRYEGDVLSKAGRNDEAAAYFERAAALAPDDEDLRKRQAWNAAEIGADELGRRVAAAPDDYDLRLLLDHALAKSRRFDDVIASWDDYLDRKPDDARAFRERGGAKWQAGRRQEGIDDTSKACDLGNAAACRDLPKMKARLGGR